MKKYVLILLMGMVGVFGYSYEAGAQDWGIPDTRTLISFADPAIVRLGDPQNPDSFGTGTFIAPNKILTAGHVATQFGDNLTIYRGAHLGYESEPLTITRVDVHPMYKMFRSSSNDVAVITTSESVNQFYNYQMVLPFTNTRKDFYEWTGYPFDLNYNFDTNTSSYNQYFDRGYASRYSNLGRSLIFNHVSAGGQSGSALVSRTTGNVVGALQGGRDYTQFTLLTGTNYSFVRNNVQR